MDYLINLSKEGLLMAKTKKRKSSPAQLAALRKGRAALKAKRGKAKTPRRKRRSSTSAKQAPEIVVVEQQPKRKRKLKSTGGYTMSKREKIKKAAGSTVRRASAIARRAGLYETVMDTGKLIIGGVGSAMLVNKLPIQNPIIKSATPIVAGAILAGTIGKKQPVVRCIATGMMTIGLISVFRKLAPNVPFLAGENMYLLPAPATQLPYYGRCGGEYSMGEEVALGGAYRTPANY